MKDKRHESQGTFQKQLILQRCITLHAVSSFLLHMINYMNGILHSKPFYCIRKSFDSQDKKIYLVILLIIQMSWKRIDSELSLLEMQLDFHVSKSN